jgi:hypothetical protein
MASPVGHNLGCHVGTKLIVLREWRMQVIMSSPVGHKLGCHVGIEMIVLREWRTVL